MSLFFITIITVDVIITNVNNNDNSNKNWHFFLKKSGNRVKIRDPVGLVGDFMESKPL